MTCLGPHARRPCSPLYAVCGGGDGEEDGHGGQLGVGSSGSRACVPHHCSAVRCLCVTACAQTHSSPLPWTSPVFFSPSSREAKIFPPVSQVVNNTPGKINNLPKVAQPTMES